jgi:hypothetical protein
LDLCYVRGAPPPYSVKVKVAQDKKEIVPISDSRFAYAGRTDEYSFLPANGEKIKLELDPARVDSSDLEVSIEKPSPASE